MFKVSGVECNKKDEWVSTISWNGPVPVLYLKFESASCVEHHGTENTIESNVRKCCLSIS